MAINFNSQIQSLYAGNVANDAAYQAPGTYGIPVSDIAAGIASFSGITAGTGYTSIPAVSFTGGTTGLTGGGGAVAFAKMKVLTATVAAGGTGYVVGNTINLGNGVVFTVATLSGSAVATFTVTNGGSLSSIPANPVAQVSTNGAGTGATFNFATFGLESLDLRVPGAYTSAPTVVFTGGAGTGAAATAVLSNNAAETKMLTLIEVVRSYFASVTGPEARAARDVLRRMINTYSGGSTAYDSAASALKMQRAGVRLFATQLRADS